MEKVKKSDFIKLNDTDKCKLMIKIIRRRSGIYKGVIVMNEITRETRKESYEKIQLKKKNKIIYENLGNEEFTARELANKMHNTFDEDGNRLLRTAERQETAPRLTELVKLGLVKVISKKFDEMSGCKVAVYRKVE